MIKIKEVHIWSNGDVSIFTGDKNTFKGFILNPEVIEVINKSADENTKFGFGVMGDDKKMIDMNLGWWFKKVPSSLKVNNIEEGN